ncbi:hypothetical protein JCM6882_003780 [Rhodosporidiobolus microsporus]
MDSLFCLGSPPVDSSTQKALRLPIINPVSRHGRILHAHSPADLNLTDAEVQNSNIIAGVASLIVRLIAGPLCDRFGPRYVLVAALWLSAIPSGVAGTAHNAMGLYFVRFFMGIAGAVFVPCQVFMAAWFDKKVIGTASAFAAGWGDAGVGVTFFVMPAVFNSFHSSRDHPERVAWRLSFIVPCILLLVCGLAVLLLNDDTPTGPWATRNMHQPRRGSTEPLNSVNSSVTVFDRPIRSPPAAASPTGKGTLPSADGQVDIEKAQGFASEVRRGSEASAFSAAPPSSAPAKQSFGSQLKDLACLPTLILCATYFSTFGCALVVNSVLVNWYMEKFLWDQNTSGNWTALFGLLNIVARPFGGVMADCFYRRFGEKRGLLAKKFWMSLLCTLGGVLALLVGLLNLKSPAGLIGLISVLAVFIEAGNGATYALLPHVNPHINGLVGGVTGASGNLGGIVFSTIARYSTIPKTIWIVGVVGIVVGLLVAIPHPIPRNKRTLYQAPTGAAS